LKYVEISKLGVVNKASIEAVAIPDQQLLHCKNPPRRCRAARDPKYHPVENYEKRSKTQTTYKIIQDPTSPNEYQFKASKFMNCFILIIVQNQMDDFMCAKLTKWRGQSETRGGGEPNKCHTKKGNTQRTQSSRQTKQGIEQKWNSDHLAEVPSIPCLQVGPESTY